MSTLFFTSDTHFGHANSIMYCKRPWDTVEEMNEGLIENWNATVGKNDLVYHLGDVSYSGTKDKVHARDYLSRLNGQIHVLIGNHDSEKQLGECLAEGVIRSVEHVAHIRHRKYGRFFLSHYAHRFWKGSGKGVYHLYGHCHGDADDYNRSMDVGVDAVGNYAPIHVGKVVELLQDAVDTPHHRPREIEVDIDL